MKTKYIFNILLIFIIILTSCREITVSTTVHEDGTFTRVITITGDSSDVLKPDLPYPIDSTWIRNMSKDSSDTKNFTLTYTKTFKNSRMLNKEIAQDTGWRKDLVRHIEIKKRFGFFYSYPIYREVIKAANPFSQYDYSDYLNADDLKWLTGKKVVRTKEDSALLKSADDRATDYLVECITIEIIKVLEKGLTQLDNPQLIPQNVILYKDSIKHRLDDDYEDLSIYIDFYATWTADSAVKQLSSLQPPLFEELNKTTTLLLKVWGMKGYKVDVVMPGIIMETNSIKLNGNKVEWGVDAMSVIFEDYEMYVESRIVNKWAFYVAGVVLILLIILLIVKVRK